MHAAWVDWVDDHRAMATWDGAVGYAGLGRMDDARRLARQHHEIASKLTPHHRLHAASLLAMIEELAGDWASMRELGPSVELAVEANLATPCRLNERSLLLYVLALAHLGDEAGARRLELKADDIGMEGYGRSLSAPRMRLALLRPDTYLEPFALRALGIVRDDADLLEQAASRFDATSLDWHAEQTHAVLAGA